MYFCDKKSLEDKNIIIISKKLGNAPYRNYIRRCTKEILRKYHKKNEKRLFFIFHKTEKNIKYSDIEKKLNSDFVF